MPVDQVDTDLAVELEVHRVGVVLDESGLGLDTEPAQGHVDRLTRGVECVAATLVGAGQGTVLTGNGCANDWVPLAVGHLTLDGEAAVHDSVGRGGHVDDTGAVADITAVARRRVGVGFLGRLGERTLDQRCRSLLVGRRLDQRDRTRDVGCRHRGAIRNRVCCRWITDISGQGARTQHTNTGRTHVRLDVLTRVVVRVLAPPAGRDVVVDVEPVDNGTAREVGDVAGVVRGPD